MTPFLQQLADDLETIAAELVRKACDPEDNRAIRTDAAERLKALALEARLGPPRQQTAAR